MPQPSSNLRASQGDLSLPPRENHQQVRLEELSLENPLNQIQRIAGWRPVVLVGEGSHRTHEFFAFQAKVAWEAIEMGCQRIFLEVPSLFTDDLRDIIDSGAGREKVKQLVANNFYPTWSDSSIVELLQKIYDRNQNRNLPSVTVEGLDPQVRGVEQRLKLYMGELNSEHQEIFRFLSEAYNLCMAHFKSYQTALNTQSAHSSVPETFGKLKESINDFVSLVKPLLERRELPQKIQKFLVRLHEGLDLYTLPQYHSMQRRDWLMAMTVVNAVTGGSGAIEASKAPQAVVLAHNGHVAFGPPKKDGWSLSEGMGRAIRRGLDAKLGGQNCTVICQVSRSGTLARFPTERDTKSYFTHDSMIKGPPSDLIAERDDRRLLLHFGSNQEQDSSDQHGDDTGWELCQFGSRAPEESAEYKLQLNPKKHMSFLVDHPKTMAADWVTSE